MKILRVIIMLSILIISATAEAQQRRLYRGYGYRGFDGYTVQGNYPWHRIVPLAPDPPKPAPVPPPVVINNNVTVVIQQPANQQPSSVAGSYCPNGTDVRSIPYKTQIYYWVDSKGTLNFSDVPNGRGTK